LVIQKHGIILLEKAPKNTWLDTSWNQRCIKFSQLELVGTK